MESYMTTPAGRRRLEERLSRARGEYQKVVASNPEAAEAGDSSVWHDNFAYEENQRSMHQWARRVRDLEALLQRIETVEPGAVDGAVVLGCRVVFEDANTGARQSVVLAGFDDSDSRAGRVGYNTPLGHALVGARVGELRSFAVPAGLREIEILELHPATTRDEL
jgi:transcription elongation GreA/GreB family factor